MKNSYLAFILSWFVMLITFSFNSTVQAQVTMINANSSWKYLDNGSNLGAEWRSPLFNDAAWSSGASELGFGDAPITGLTPGRIGYYFRNSINISNPSQFLNFTMKIRRDDGIVIYINNVEVYRNNMPAGTISYNTVAAATCTDDGNAVMSATLANSLFVNGNNTIAAEVHNRSTGSSDITFELQLIANPIVVGACTSPNTNLFGNRNITSTTAEVFWSPIVGAQSYNVAYRIRNLGAAYSAPIVTNSSAVVLFSLLPSTNYEFIVQTNCAGGGNSSFSPSGWFTTSTGTTPPPPTCGTPDGNTFVSTNISSTAATINWATISGVQSYNSAFRIFNSGAAYSASINGVPPSNILANLSPGTIYEFIVQSLCPGNVLSPFSSARTFTTLSGPVGTCATPNLNLFGNRNKTSTTAEVFWSAMAGAQSYNVEYRIRNIGVAYSAPVNTLVPAMVLSNLQPATNYEFIVQTVCTGNALSVFSSSGWFTTLTGGSPTTTLLRGPYMPVVTSTGITIQWRTGTATNSEVRYGTSVGVLNNTFVNAGVVTEHSMTLSGLVPNTKYYYSIGAIGSALQGDVNNFFYTAPINGTAQAVKFWVTGDFGNGSAGQLAVRNSFTNYTAGQTVNGWIWLGDNAYSNGTDAEYQSEVFNVYNSIFKQIPVFPAPGNHDYAQSGYQSAASLGANFPYFNIFTLPAGAGTEKYYSTNYANIHFISLDSYGSYNNSGSAMYNWLSNDLATNTQQWTIVYFHHPPYSKGSHDSDNEIELLDMRTNVTPLLEAYGVDLVLSGHSHSYERSYLIRNHTGLESTFSMGIYPSGNIVQAGGGPYTKSSRTANGTIYLVCGVSGQSGGSTPGYPHNAMFRSNITGNGSLILDINGGSLSCKYLTSAGVIDDQFSIQKPVAPAMTQTVGGRQQNQSTATPLVYPNPSAGEINISMNNKEEIVLNVSIANLAGIIFFQKTYSKTQYQNIQIEKQESNLSSGIYIINISGENINQSSKLVVY